MKLQGLANVSDLQYVLVGAKEERTLNTYKIAAVGRYNDVFKPPVHVNGDEYKALQGLGPRAAYWYRQDGVSFGFAPAEKVVLGLADTEGLQGDCAKRLSWPLDNGLGGWRAGCKKGGEITNTWVKVVKLCSSTRYGVRTGVRLMDYSSLTLPVYRVGSWSSSQAVNPIKIGVALTLDCRSKRQKQGLILRRAYQLFVEWVNTVRGGVYVQGVMRPLELVMVGDDSDSSASKLGTEWLMQNESINLFLGPYGSALTNDSARVVQQHGGTMVASVATAESVFADNPNIFSVYMRGADTFEKTLQELASAGVKSIAYVRQSNFPEACQALHSHAATYNITMKWNYTFASDEIDGDIDVIDAYLRPTDPSQKADALFGCVYQTVCEKIVRTIIDRKINIDAIIMTVCLGSSTWIAKFGNSGRFIGGTTPWLPSMGFVSEVSSWSSFDFDAAYKQAFQEDAGYHAALGWAAGVALAIGIELANSTDPNAVAAALRWMDNATIFGSVKFNSIGMNTNPYKTVQYLPTSDQAIQVAPLHTQKYVYPIPPWSMRECFEYNANSPLPCSKGLRHCNNSCPDERWNLQCVTCPEEESPRWNLTTLGNNMGCICIPRKCSPGEILNTSNTQTIDCDPCPVGKFATLRGTCEDCLVGTFASTPATAKCHQCPAGKANNLTGQTACQDCPPGRTSHTDGAQFCSACRVGSMSNIYGASSCWLCDPGKVAEDTGSQVCHDCQRGRRSVWGGYECETCPVGKFQSQPRMSQCKDCPLGALCYRNGTVSPDNADNWWRYHNLPQLDDWMPCPEEGICLSKERCVEGQTDALCAVCVPGYSRSFETAKCEKCPPFERLVVFAVIGCILLFVGTITVTSVAVKSALKSRAIADALLKLLLNYFTTISMTTGVLKLIFLKKMEEDTRVTGIMPKAEYGWMFWLLSFSIREMILPVLQLECFFDRGVAPQDQHYVDTLQQSNYSNYFDPSIVVAREWLQDYHWNSSYKVMLCWLLGPPVLLVCIVLVCIILLLMSLECHRQYWRQVNELVDLINAVGYSEARKGKDRNTCIKLLESVDSKLFGIFSYYKFAEKRGCDFVKHFIIDAQPIAVVSLFLIYPTLLQMLLDPLWCVEPARGLFGHVHSRHYNRECYQGNDSLFWMAIIGLVFLCIGVPAFSAFKILPVSHKDNVQDLTFLRTWSFLIAGYEHGSEYWECVVLVRKSLIVVLAAISINDGVRVLALLVVAASFSLLHVRCRPFDNRFDELLDRVENRHLLVWVLFCLAILWIYLGANFAARKAESQLIGSIYNPENTTIYFAAGIMCVLHLLFVGSLLFSIIDHAAMNHSEYLVNLAEKRHFLYKTHSESVDAGDGIICSTASEGSLGPSQACTTFTMVESTRSGSSSGRGISIRTKFSRFVHTVRNEQARHKYQDMIAKKCFGKWAHLHYDWSMDGKAHVLIDSRNMWITLSGTHSHGAKPHHEIDQLLSQKKLPPLSLPANEDHRRYFLKIILEAMHYVIVALEIEPIPMCLLEFVFRCGFTFKSMGELRMAAKRSTAHERTNNMARVVAASKLADSGDKNWSSVNSLLRASVSSPYGSETVGMHASESLTDTQGANTKSSGSPRGGQMPPTPQSVETSGMMLASSKSDARMSARSTAELMFHSNSDARERRMKGEYLPLADEEIRGLVKEMFAPDIFDEAMCLEDLQLNLTMLRKTTRGNVVKWLAFFEEECIYQRALRCQGLHESRHQYRLDLQKIRSARFHEQKMAGLVAFKRGSTGLIDATGKSSSSGMQKYDRTSIVESSSEEEDDDESLKSKQSDAFLADQCTQTDLHTGSDLAAAITRNAKFKDCHNMTTLNSAFNDDVLGMRRMLSDGSVEDDEIGQRWVLICANVIQMADERAAKEPATYAYNKCRSKEKKTKAEIIEIESKIKDLRTALKSTRDRKGDQYGAPETNLRPDRTDLGVTRTAIIEAKALIENLKNELAELQNHGKPQHEGDEDEDVQIMNVKNPTNKPKGDSCLRICACTQDQTLS